MAKDDLKQNVLYFRKMLEDFGTNRAVTANIDSFIFWKKQIKIGAEI
jgi:hypothetical protein